MYLLFKFIFDLITIFKKNLYTLYFNYINMLDINLFRENPEIIKENLKKKFQDDKIKIVDEIIKLDEQVRKLIYEAENLRKERNTLSKSIADAKKKGEDASEFLKKAKELPNKIKEIEDEEEELKEKMNKLLVTIPNIIHKSVPIGKDDSENVEIEKIGKPKKFDFDIKSHVELAEELGVVDFESSAETSGNGFYYLKGDLALLNMALINFARDHMVKIGYTYMETPLMIRRKVVDGVMTFEEMDNMIYKIEDEDLYLIGTSEHSLIGKFMNKPIDEKKLPLKLTSYSMCFRKEVGSHGIDERGLFRTHQFNKQEMVVICHPNDSYKFYDEMLNITKDIFRKLELPIRVLESCSGDLAGLKAKATDVEVWSPRRNEYVEVASVSNTTDAQARRLNIKVKGKDGRYYPHILNNTAIATSRALVGILENNQNEDGSVDIPDVLVQYMYGKNKIEKQ